MSRDYDSLIRALGLPSTVADCAAGRIRLPLGAMRSPAEWYGFPPVLIPIWSDGSGPNYIGVWKHWFTDRPLSFVKMYVGSGRTSIEIARTPEQLFCYMAMATIVVDDGVEPELADFCKAVGIRNLAEIDKVSLETGDDPSGLTALSPFATSVPRASTSDPRHYTGAFPTSEFSERQWWLDACSFEVPDDVLATWPEAIDRPRWLVPGDKASLFQQLVDAGRLHEAWLSLNSAGWSFSDARSAITELDRVANDDHFSLLARAWLAVADEGAGSY